MPQVVHDPIEQQDVLAMLSKKHTRCCARCSRRLPALGTVGDPARLAGAVRADPDATHLPEIRQSANWAAITCVVVTAPLIGQVAEVSVFRTVGTILGGAWGFFVWSVGNWIAGGYA